MDTCSPFPSKLLMVLLESHDFERSYSGITTSKTAIVVSAEVTGESNVNVLKEPWKLFVQELSPAYPILRAPLPSVKCPV